MNDLLSIVRSSVRRFGTRLVVRNASATAYSSFLTPFLVASAVTVLDIILEVGLRPASNRLAGFRVAVGFYAEDTVVNLVILLAAEAVLFSAVFIFRVIFAKVSRKVRFPRPFIFAASAALLVVFISAVQLKTTVLPPLHSLKTRAVVLGLVCSIPVLSFLFVQVGRLLRRYSGSKAFRTVTAAAAALSGVVIVAGFLYPAARAGDVKVGAAPPGAPNILIIVVDALRRDFVSYYGAARAETPNIDGLATRSVVYTDAYANAPWTVPSVYTMLTSRYPTVHGATSRRPGGENIPTLAEVLKEYGYETDAYLANSLINPEIGFGRGFSRYITYVDVPPLFRFKHSTLYLFLIYLRARGYWTGNADTTLWLSDILEDRFKKKREKPFFVWAHYMDPHGPLTPPVEYITGDPSVKEKAKLLVEKQKRMAGRIKKTDKDATVALYRAEVEYVDRSLGELFETMEEEGLLDNTLIIITADHGEELFERTRYGHAKTHFPEVMAVPLIIYAPGRTPAVYDTPVSLIDVMPTVLGYVGADAPDGAFGRDLLDLVSAVPPGPEGTRVFFEGPGRPPARLVSVYEPPYILTRRGREPYEYILVDTRVPAGAEDVIADPPPEVLEYYKGLLEAFITGAEAEAAEVERPPALRLDSARREELKALGYF